MILSLLGPDDFDLDSKARRKKLAKDLAPEMQKQIERWIDQEEDEQDILKKLSERYGIEKAKQILSQIKKRRKID